MKHLPTVLLKMALGKCPVEDEDAFAAKLHLGSGSHLEALRAQTPPRHLPIHGFTQNASVHVRVPMTVRTCVIGMHIAAARSAGLSIDRNERQLERYGTGRMIQVEQCVALDSWRRSQRRSRCMSRMQQLPLLRWEAEPYCCTRGSDGATQCTTSRRIWSGAARRAALLHRDVQHSSGIQRGHSLWQVL